MTRRNLGMSVGLARARGFTLVEMAVVLVVIGVIMAAVMIGRDVQRNAEYTKIRQTFINQWALAYNTYVQRTGVPVGDNPLAPQLMVNGQNFAAPSGGNMTGAALPGAICRGAANAGMARPAQAGVSLRDLMLGVGVELPQGRAPGSEDRYVYLDTNGNPQELQVCFQWNPPGTRSGTGNVMVISGLTPDLARSLASGIKGNADASSGSFRQEGVTVGAGGAGGVVSVPWEGDNTQAFGATGTAAGTDREVQVRTVVAHYKMNQ